MTEEKYLEAKHLQEEIKNLKDMIAFAENKGSKFYLGYRPDHDNVLDAKFFYGEDVRNEYDKIREKARKELVEFLSSKLNKLKEEFENV